MAFLVPKPSDTGENKTKVVNMELTMREHIPFVLHVAIRFLSVKWKTVVEIHTD